MDFLESKKEELCKCLSNNPDNIIEQCGNILTINDLKDLNKESTAEKKSSILLSKFVKMGEKCQAFKDILEIEQKKN